MEELKMKNKQIEKGFVILALLIIILNLTYVNAFSVGFGSAVNIEPGQTAEKSFTLINKGINSENLVVEVNIEEGSEYMTLSQGTRYEVPAGEIKSVPAVFKVPANAKSGDVYNVKVNFNTLEGGVVGGGSIEFNTGYTFSFDINVMEKVPISSEPEEQPAAPEGINIWWIVLAIIVIIAVIAVIYFLVKGNSETDVKKVVKK